MGYLVKVITPLGIKHYNDALITDLKHSGDRSDEYLCDVKEKISGKVVFTGSDYQLFKTIDQSNLRYEPMYLKVFDVCNGTEYIKMNGVLSFLEAQFDDNKCTVTITVNAEDKYLRFDQEKDTEYNIINSNPFAEGYIFPKYTATAQTSGGQGYYFDNGVLLNTVLDWMYKKINPIGEIKSELLTTGFFKRILIFQKSDIVRHSALANAWMLKTTLAKLLNGICKLLNAGYRIDEFGNLVIERYETLQAQGSINDLTVGEKEYQTKGLRRWEYDQETAFKYETFSLQDSRNADFMEKKITYENALVDAIMKNAENKIEHEFITDIEYLFSLNPLDENIEYAGMVLIATNEFSQTYRTTGSNLQTPARANNVLSMTYLAWNRYRFARRLFKTGKIGATATTFSNIQKSKTQSSLLITDCCGGNFNYRGAVKTELGTGILQSFEMDFSKRQLQIDVAFEPIDSTQIVIPKTVTDWYYTNMGVANFDSQMAGFPSLKANDNVTANAVVTAETKATYLGGQVTIYSNGHFKYTPPSNVFYGLDTFDYTVVEPNGYTGLGFAKMAVRWNNRFVRNVVEWKQGSIHQGIGNTDGCDPETAESTLLWFKDAAGTQPLDVTGYNLRVDIVTYNGAQVQFIPTGQSQYLGIKYNGPCPPNTVDPNCCQYFGIGGVYGNTYAELDTFFPNPDYTVIP